MSSWLGNFEKHEILVMLFWGWVTYLFHVSVLYIVHNSPFLCVCGDDWITRYKWCDRWARRCI